MESRVIISSAAVLDADVLNFWGNWMNAKEPSSCEKCSSATTSPNMQLAQNPPVV